MATNCTRQLLPDVNRQDLTYFMEKLMNKICNFYDEQDLIDVTFKLSNPTAFVPAHRLILSAASPYLKRLLNGCSGTTPVIELDNIDSDAFEHLVTFCYTGKANITIANVDQMLKGAIVLELDDVITSCADYLMEYISEYTLERAYSLERETQCALLKEKILEYEVKNFNEASECAEFLNFGAERLQALIESDKLNVTGEEDVYRAVKRWYEYDVPARQQKLPELIECLRLTQFDANFLVRNIQSIPGCELLALTAISWNALPLQRELFPLRFTKAREGLSKKLLAVNINGGDASIFQYDNPKDEWQTYAVAKLDVTWYSVVLLDDNLIFIGGQQNGSRSNVVKSWNFRTESWKALPSMNEPRGHLCAVELYGKIYAIGGIATPGNAKNTVEMYSAGNGWKLVSNMRTMRYDAGGVTLNDKIFVMGGYDSQRGLKSVECYDPSTDIWTQCADMNEVHNLPGVAVHNGHIYVIGGYTSSTSVERYDPQRNTWTMVCSLNVGRGGMGCVSMDNQLWAIGGYDAVNSASVYNPECDTWVEKKPVPRSGMFSCYFVPRGVLQRNQNL